MIHIYVGIALAILVGAILWFPVYAVLTAVITRTTIPSDMMGNWTGFILSIRNWYLFLFVLVGLIIWVIVQSQKPEVYI